MNIEDMNNVDLLDKYLNMMKFPYRYEDSHIENVYMEILERMGDNVLGIGGAERD